MFLWYFQFSWCLSPSIVFLFFFALFIEEAFFVSPCCSLELCIQLVILFPFFLALSLSSFLSYLKKCRILAQDSWDAYKRNDFSKPRLLYLPIHRKVLNSLTWDIWFSLIHRKTFDVETTCPLLRKFYITWLFPCYLLRVFSRGYLRCCLPELRLKNFHWINYNSQLLVCGYF